MLVGDVPVGAGRPQPLLALLATSARSCSRRSPCASCGTDGTGAQRQEARSEGPGRSAGRTWRTRWRPPRAALGLPARPCATWCSTPGRPDGLGASRHSRPHRGAPGPRRPRRGRRARTAGRASSRREAADPLAGIREVVRALAETAGLDVSVEIEEGREAVVARLDGPDRVFFLGEDGRAVLRALEHLLQRMFAARPRPALAPGRVRGLPRPARCRAARREARRWPRAVRSDGQPRAPCRP